MAVAASAVWRIRPNGADLNGSGYDGTSYPGGTDYSQQDAAQATFTATLSTSAANSTTLLNSANTFTAAMVGNAIWLASGTNAVVGAYFITAFASTGSVTLDRTPATAGALAAGTGRVGGAKQNFMPLISSGTNYIAAGNQVFVYTPTGVRNRVTTTLAAAISSTSATSMTVSSATGFPSTNTFWAIIDNELVQITAGAGTTSWTIVRARNASVAATHLSGATVTLVEYVITGGPYNSVSGNLTDGFVTISGQNGRPHIHVDGRLLDSSSNYVAYKSICHTLSPSGGFALFVSGTSFSLQDCYFNTLDPGGTKYASGMVVNPAGVFGCEFECGSLTPTTGGTIPAINFTNGSVCGNIFRGMPGVALSIYGSSNVVLDNVIYKQGGNAIPITGNGSSDHFCVLRGNTIDACSGDAISFDGVGALVRWRVENNLLTNNVGSGKAALRISGALTAAQNTRCLEWWGGNFFYNNTSNFVGCVARSVDVVGTDPGYTAPATGDHSIGIALKATGGNVNTLFATRSFVDPGAAQRQEPSASSAVLRRPSLNGVG